ncbi:hypothetical protein RFI_05677 [Reticulomyxa filosa]|uniref:Uncharacterized protein n=1 Tax=Reticulomyxa filosa TaxID=46433 RepID=X6NZY6_RETFI|nr:hypothetical protein RFI_05677 [Reticulomyxa filosa]|eukprot:ETO31443.1 hypothetical protein RFI_05677 [Reticulomyxa filosa]
MNGTLKKLRMNINRVGVKGARVLAKVLLKNNCLEELELSYNEIFNEGVQYLSQGLQQNYGLKCLVLWYNGLDDQSAHYFAEVIKDRALKQDYFKDQMLEAIVFILRVKYYNSDKLAAAVGEIILSFTPRYMEFALDISHNRRIGRTGINALLDVGERNDAIFVKGFKDYLVVDRKLRNEIALENTSLY